MFLNVEQTDFVEFKMGCVTQKYSYFSRQIQNKHTIIFKRQNM